MAEKQLSRKQNAEDGFFADDDPLAALARIASFDPQGEIRPRASNQRREPEFNLEDELLKEFEQYEEPASSVPLLDEPVNEMRSADQPLLADEPAFGDEEPGAPFVIGEVPPVDSAPVDAAPLNIESTEIEPVEIEPVAAFEPIPEDPEPRAVPVLTAVPPLSYVGPTEPVRPVSHPVFDLEDEILREFAAFDARRPPAGPYVNVPPTHAVAAEPVPEIVPEPAVLPQAIARIDQPVSPRIEPVFTFSRTNAVETQSAVAARDAVEAHDARPGYGDDDLIAEAEVLPETVPVEPSALDVPALDAMEAEVDAALWSETKQPIIEDEETLEADEDIEDEIEEPVQFEAEPAITHAGVQERWEDEVSVEPAVQPEEELAAEDIDLDLDIDAEPESYIPSDDVFAEPEIEAKAEKAPEPAPVVVPPMAAESRKDDFDLDELLADVERYPVAATPARWPNLQPKAVEPPVEQQVVAPAEQVVAAVPPVVAAAAEPEIIVAAQPEGEPLPIVAPIVTPKDVPVVAVAVAAIAKPVVAPKVDLVTSKVEPIAAAKDVEPFDDGAFELDLTEIELDMLEMEVESSVAPSLHQDQITASKSVLADVAKATVEEKPTYERSFTLPPRVTEDYSSLPFDPSQISGEEDPVEAIAEMDVPEAPVAEHDVPVAAQPDYDIDIDAEMAHIFARPAEPAQRPASAQAKSAQQAAPAAATMTSADLDEFERALEEDFRRSLSENRAGSTPDRVALTPSSFNEGRRESSTGRRLTILAASVAGLVLIGGAGVYAYWGNGSRILSASSEPKIILADKDPVKIQPKERGGQQVPNQDKAVYDRVSGDDKDITKQERLVTSNEEPVDVVQKTLMPENLPLDDDDQASATDTTDTSDPRLLPDGQDKNITTTEKVVSGVSPRKVRTMVVRSDGTLVPRDEEPAADETKEMTPAEASEDRPLDVTPAVTENVPERLAANDDVAKEIEQASADTKAFVPGVQKPSDVVESKPVQADDNTQVAADQPVTEEQPVAQDQSVTEDPAAAATEEKPAVDDSATVADTKPVEKEELAAPATQTGDTVTDNTAAVNTAVAKTVDENAAADTAPADNAAATDNAAADNAKPADQAALTDAANADVEETAPIREVKTTKITNTPIPANRPVDQPVDIVGRVTDQGNVQKNQEVANADPVQPVQSTATPSGAYVIQIASLPSEAEAQKSYSKLSNKFANVIGGRGVDIKKAAIKNKGTYYRVRIPVGTRQEATELCARYKAAGGSCLVSK